MSLTPCCNTQAFHLASAINNIGVTMLLKGEFRAAANTTKDALTIVKMVLSARENIAGNSNSRNDESFILYFARQRLQAATSRLAEIMNSNSSVSTSMKNMGFFRVSQVESNDLDSLKQACVSNAFHFSAVMIREPCTAVAYDCISTIMIYNHGLAYFLYTSFGELEDDMNTSDLHEVAEKSLFMAYTGFSRILMSTQDSTQEMEAALYCMLSLSLTSQVLKARNENDKAQEMELAQQDLFRALKVDHPLSFLTDQIEYNMAAPAA